MNRIIKLLDWTPVECELCETVCCYRKGIDRIQKGTWTEGAMMTGESKKYPGRIAAYCENHKIY